jgi:hypothetical protein
VPAAYTLTPCLSRRIVLTAGFSRFWSNGVASCTPVTASTRGRASVKTPAAVTNRAAERISAAVGSLTRSIVRKSHSFSLILRAAP